jgi:hypothetical protein
VTLKATDRWWTIHDEAIVTALVRVESGDVTAAEVYAQLVEHSTSESYAEDRDG